MEISMAVNVLIKANRYTLNFIEYDRCSKLPSAVKPNIQNEPAEPRLPVVKINGARGPAKNLAHGILY